MELRELKQQINDKRITDELMVFLADDGHFLVNQYVSEICKTKKMDMNFISCLADLCNTATSLVFKDLDYMNILRTDNFDEILADYTIFHNTIIVCDKIDKRITDRLQDNIIVFPKLKDWQIKAIAEQQCTGISAEDTTWLYEAVQGDIYRFTNEIDKIKLFNESMQRDILSELRNDSQSDLFVISPFDLAEAIIRHNLPVIVTFLDHKNIMVDPFALIAILLSNFKKILLVNFDNSLTPDAIGITQKQYNAVRYYYKGISIDSVLKNIDFLAGLDQKLKNGQLELSKELLTDYIICNILT